MQRRIVLNGESVVRNRETNRRAVFSSLQGPNLTFFAAPQPRAETRPVNLRALIRLLEGVFSWGKGGCSHRRLMITRSKPVPVVGPSRRILRVKYNEILTIPCNENAGFAGLSAIFTPSRENSYDKVQRDIGRPTR